MKISWNWLREFVEADFASAQDLGEKLTLHTCEVEEIIKTADRYEGVFTGKIVDIKPHPKSEKLSVAQFDLGDKGIKQGIFGKVHVVEKGEILPIALAGAVLASGIEIKDTIMAGEKTQCMIADNKELGMKNEGLLRFESGTKLGQPLSKAVKQADDYLIDIDNKSLTHRPDLMGHSGFAREMAAIANANLLFPEPVVSLPSNPAKVVEVDIQSECCSRFCAIAVDNVTVAPSDYDTLFRLEHLGIKSISNVVDITNIIMTKFGQPMHAFDADKITGKIIVRQAREGESLVALDGVEYELSPEDTVVADEKGVLSIAGIMGGLASGVTAGTKNVIFECAHWNPTRVRLTSQRLGLRSDSAMRYEKSLDREACKRAILSATEKLQACCPSSIIVSDLTDEYPRKDAAVSIVFSPSKVSLCAGVAIDDAYTKNTLEHLGFTVRDSSLPWQVEVPSFRATKDVSIEEDLVEEVVRMYGFENLPSTLPTFPIEPPEPNVSRELQWRLKDFLAALKYFEIYGYSFSHEDEARFTGQPDFVTVKNPLSSEHQHLRQSLSYNLVKRIESELRTHRSCDFFEIGNVFTPTSGVSPEEHSKLLMCQARISGDENALFYELKDDFLSLMHSFGLKSVDFRPTETVPFLHPFKSAEILINDNMVGYIGVLHPQHAPTKECQIVLLEVDMGIIVELFKAQEVDYKKLNPFPSVHRDLSIIVDQEMLMSEVVRVALSSSPYLSQCELFDEFSDEVKIGKGLKNLAFHLTFRSPEGTLDDEVIDAAFKAVTDKVKTECKAELRLEFDKK